MRDMGSERYGVRPDLWVLTVIYLILPVSKMKAISFLGLLNMIKVLMHIQDTYSFDGSNKIVCMDVDWRAFLQVFFNC